MVSKVKAKKSAAPARQRKGRTTTSRISSKHQVTVPVDILRALDLSAGDVVSFEVKAGVIVISAQKQTGHPLAGLIGAGGDSYREFDLAKERSPMWPR